MVEIIVQCNTYTNHKVYADINYRVYDELYMVVNVINLKLKCNNTNQSEHFRKSCMKVYKKMSHSLIFCKLHFKTNKIFRPIGLIDCRLIITPIKSPALIMLGPYISFQCIFVNV